MGDAHPAPDDPAEQQDLLGVPATCPLCGQVHERCLFATGSLYCTRPDCGNPHHREPGWPGEGGT